MQILLYIKCMIFTLKIIFLHRVVYTFICVTDLRICSTTDNISYLKWKECIVFVAEQKDKRKRNSETIFTRENIYSSKPMRHHTIQR